MNNNKLIDFFLRVLMTKGNEIEELTNIFRTLITQQHNLEQQHSRLNE